VTSGSGQEVASSRRGIRINGPDRASDFKRQRGTKPRIRAVECKYGHESFGRRPQCGVGEVEKRGILRLNLVSLMFSIVGIVATLSAAGAVLVAPLLLSRIGRGAMTEAILSILRWPALLMGMLTLLSILYRYGLSRREAKWKWISVGAIFATLACLLGRVGSGALSYYFDSFAKYDVAYGSLGAAIGTMMWILMSAIAILFGAELNSEIEHQTARDTTVRTGPKGGAARYPSRLRGRPSRRGADTVNACVGIT